MGIGHGESQCGPSDAGGVRTEKEPLLVTLARAHIIGERTYT